MTDNQAYSWLALLGFILVGAFLYPVLSAIALGVIIGRATKYSGVEVLAFIKKLAEIELPESIKALIKR